MVKVGLVAWITFKESIRNKALFGIFFCGIGLFLANIIITGMFSWEIGKVAVDVGLSVVTLSGLLIIFFLSIQMMSNDLERKTIYLILSKPISKQHYILGKFIGLAGIITVSSLVLGAGAVLSVKLSIFGSEQFMPHHFSWSTLLLGLCFLNISLLVVLAMAFLCISVTSHSFTAVLLCMATYFIGQNVESVATVIKRSKIFDSNIALLKLLAVIEWIFPNLAAFDLKTTAAYGLPVDSAYLAWVAAYGLAYIGLCLVAAIWIFQRRELA
jgi:ABC-type transport system involved in multi-copper enzyme maturation permease subunit